MFFNLFRDVLVMNGQTQERSHLPGYVLFISGALSGLFSNALTYPMDVVRRKMQLTNVKKGSGNDDLQVACKKMILCSLTIQKEFGIKGFFIGIVPSLIKSAVSTSVTFLIYEKIIEFL